MGTATVKFLGQFSVAQNLDPPHRPLASPRCAQRRLIHASAVVKLVQGFQVHRQMYVTVKRALLKPRLGMRRISGI